MSETETKKVKPQLDITKLHYTDKIPERKTKSSVDWLPILKNLMSIKTSNNVLKISEDEASIGSVQNQMLKTIDKYKLTGIVINRRNVDKKQCLFISYKK